MIEALRQFEETNETEITLISVIIPPRSDIFENKTFILIQI